MTGLVSIGKCFLCGGAFSKATMRRHLDSCIQRRAASGMPPSGRLKETRILRLVVEGRDLPEYWMHLEVKADATLKDLDYFLRDIWLECCGHLSAFTIEGKSYVSELAEDFWFNFGNKEEGMDVKMGDVLKLGMKFIHQYDFGTTTELTLRVLSEREDELKNPVHLLARNEPPLITCGVCGKTATQVCTQCIYSGEGWLCDECAQNHKCSEEMLLPVANSPRVGMCGYTGEYEE